MPKELAEEEQEGKSNDTNADTLNAVEDIVDLLYHMSLSHEEMLSEDWNRTLRWIWNSQPNTGWSVSLVSHE